jgi:hypothetical protein
LKKVLKYGGTIRMEKMPDNRGIRERSTAKHTQIFVGISMLFIVIFLLSAGCIGSRGPRIMTTGDPLMMIELTDVKTGAVFSLSSFPDRPVLIQTFTLTCPVCMQQQKEITRLHDSGRVPFVMIGLDIDPNGNSASLLSYTETQGYYGVYARSPPEMTRLLIDRFGTPVLTPSQAPLILICRDGTATLLPSGIKTADQLEKALSGC